MLVLLLYVLLHSFFVVVYLFILEVGEGQRERIPSRLHAVSTEPHELELTNREIMI